MILLQSSRKLSALKDILLQQLPHSIVVYGAVAQIRHGNACNLEVCVDSWPAFKTVVCRRQRKAIQDPHNPFSNLYTLFTKDVASLRTMLKDKTVINWKQPCHFLAFPSSLFDAVQGEKQKIDHMIDPSCILIHHDPQSLPDVRTDVAPRISSLRVTHAEIVNRSVKYGGSEHSLNYIKTCIQNLPSCCILDDNGSPISWALLDESCAIRMVFTLPEYRRVGYMKVVLATLARKVHMMGFPVHLSVEENNTASLHACKSMGFTLYPDLYLTFKLIPSSLP
ncbi:glycine N-acyltransferase-like protein 3 [Acipenser ruthenus]|uniref:glycine N-acyltransferase-like protein 3 n=1 Tax=Acipenser ruthenus TaxID=7906 RepID=UPI0027419833|nr:glycine N-acyltransferase-like protein 3 [Acipenser ruthenus]